MFSPGTNPDRVDGVFVMRSKAWNLLCLSREALCCHSYRLSAYWVLSVDYVQRMSERW